MFITKGENLTWVFSSFLFQVLIFFNVFFISIDLYPNTNFILKLEIINDNVFIDSAVIKIKKNDLFPLSLKELSRIFSIVRSFNNLNGYEWIDIYYFNSISNNLYSDGIYNYIKYEHSLIKDNTLLKRSILNECSTNFISGCFFLGIDDMGYIDKYDETINILNHISQEIYLFFNERDIYCNIKKGTNVIQLNNNRKYKLVYLLEFKKK